MANELMPESDPEDFRSFKEKHGFDTVFDDNVKARFLGAIGEERFSKYVVEYLRRQNHELKDIVNRIGAVPSTWSRWKRWVNGDPKGNAPSWNYLFRYLVLAKVDLTLVFPKSEITLFRAIQECLVLVAAELEKRSDCAAYVPTEFLTPPDLAWPYMVEALLMTDFTELEKAQEKTNALDNLLRKALEALKRKYGNSARNLELRQLRQWVGGWFVPWGLFWEATDRWLDTIDYSFEQ